MNVMTQAQAQDRPPCFAQFWNPNVTECNGGPDPSYLHPKNGGHIRERCDFFNECGARVQASQGLISPTALVRSQPATQAVVPAHNASSFREYMQRKQAAEEEAEKQRRAVAIQQQQQQRVFPWMTVPVPQQQAVVYHQQQTAQHQMMPVNFTMPSYLSVSEQRMMGESIWPLLGREVFRSIGKAIGHTIASFLDHNPMRIPPPPDQK